MAEFPAMPLWTDAYLADTTHLSTIEHGAYLLLMFAMWRTPDKRLPNNADLLARYCKLTKGQWDRIGPVLMPFFRVEADSITQGRLTDEANLVRQHSKKQSDKARARWLKNKDTAHAAALPKPCRSDAPLPLPLPTKKERKILSVAEPPEFVDFWNSIPHREGPNPRFPALKAYVAAIKRGADPLQINAAAKRWNAETTAITPFVKTAVAWLNGRYYEEYHQELAK